MWRIKNRKISTNDVLARGGERRGGSRLAQQGNKVENGLRSRGMFFPRERWVLDCQISEPRKGAVPSWGWMGDEVLTK